MLKYLMPGFSCFRIKHYGFIGNYNLEILKITQILLTSKFFTAVNWNFIILLLRYSHNFVNGGDAVFRLDKSVFNNGNHSVFFVLFFYRVNGSVP